MLCFMFYGTKVQYWHWAHLYLKAYDLDDHQMTQFSPLAVDAEPHNSNSRQLALFYEQKNKMLK